MVVMEARGAHSPGAPGARCEAPPVVLGVRPVYGTGRGAGRRRHPRATFRDSSRPRPATGWIGSDRPSGLIALAEDRDLAAIAIGLRVPPAQAAQLADAHRGAEPNRGDHEVVNSDGVGTMEPTRQGAEKKVAARRRGAAREHSRRCA